MHMSRAKTANYAQIRHSSLAGSTHSQVVPMAASPNASTLRYGFDLDKSSFIDIGMNAQLVMSLFNTFICHPFPLFILIRKSPTMSTNIRRGYVVMHAAFITYEIIFFFFVRIYAILPYPGLYCEGPLCRMGLSNQVLWGFICFAIAVVQPPFAFLIISMHQMFQADGSLYKLSKRVKIAMASVQVTLMSLNVVGFVVFGSEPDNIDELLEEPELVMLVKRGGTLLLFGTPGNPQFFLSELLFFYFTLGVNFPVLCFCILHSMHSLKKTSLAAKSTQTQILTQKMFEVFFWQLHGSVVNHIIPLAGIMIFMIVDSSFIPDTVLAVLKLISFTLNSTQFCAIFVFKNSANRKMLADYCWLLIRIVTRSKVAPESKSTPPSSKPRSSVTMSMTIL